MATEILLPLLLRAGATALVVVLAAAAAERAGPFLGGLIATLPVSSGPAYVMLSLEHPPGFLAAAALGSMVGNAAAAFWLLAYVHLARRGLAAALGGATAAWVVTVWAFGDLAGTDLGGAVALNLAAYALTLLLTRAWVRAGAPPAGRLRRRWWDLPLRAVLVGALVASVVTASAALGPTLTGFVAVFPVALTSLGLVAQPRLGAQATAALMANVLRGMVGFTLATLVLHLAVVPLGPGLGMLAALATSLGWSGVLLLARRLRPRPVAG